MLILWFFFLVLLTLLLKWTKYYSYTCVVAKYFVVCYVVYSASYPQKIARMPKAMVDHHFSGPWSHMSDITNLYKERRLWRVSLVFFITFSSSSISSLLSLETIVWEHIPYLPFQPYLHTYLTTNWTRKKAFSHACMNIFIYWIIDK